MSHILGIKHDTGRGANFVADFAGKGKDGATNVIDSEFMTTGKVSNTIAQRDLKSRIGGSF